MSDMAIATIAEERVARLIAAWHRQKLVVHTRRDGNMTVAALRRFDSGWGWETDRYVEAHWDEYVDAARAVRSGRPA
jgi:hypothetical protein